MRAAIEILIRKSLASCPEDRTLYGNLTVKEGNNIIDDLKPVMQELILRHIGKVLHPERFYYLHSNTICLQPCLIYPKVKIGSARCTKSCKNIVRSGEGWVECPELTKKITGEK